MISTDRLCMGCMNDNGGEQICPICGFDAKAKNPKNTVPLKTMINDRFVVGRVLSANGEGIDYIGWDTANDAIVQIREYFPAGVAKRNPDKTVSMLKGKEYTFNEGLLEFLEINKTIKSSDLPSLIPVIDVFEENGTAFAIMQNIQGVTLGEFLSRNGGTLKWEQARALFLPLIDTIKGMHDLGIIHKGISTDTVIVGRDGKLRLTGYSINKLRYENEEVQFEVLDGFAAVEQYKTEEEFQFGPHTDVYGFCATLFNVLIGNLPAKATARLENDSMSIPSKFAEELPRQVLISLANALQVKPQDRTHDMEALKNQLVYGEIPTAVVDVADKKGNAKEKKNKSGSGKVVLVTAIVTVIFILLLAIILIFTVFRDSIFGNGNNNSQPSTPSSSSPVIDNSSEESYPDDVEKLYIVPNLVGSYYSEILEVEENENFVFVIKGKEYSSHPRGTICSQSVAKNSEVAKDTEIEIVISLGRKEFKMPNVLNKTDIEAKLELLKAGFLYENIEVLEKYDEDYAPGQIIEQYPAAGDTVNAEIGIKIYINTYEGDEYYY
ncbi:MAG: PASTA domain-containing protein [Clostridia bacterium]|nr:PASTA domain-containing protein [Clostridia bacterium]